jgi:membrane protease YdiL (CAAX protease family)
LLGAPLWSTYGKGRRSLVADFGLSMRGQDVPLGLERRLGTGWAVAVSSLVFRIIHFQLYDLRALLAFSLVAALLTVRTGRLGPAVWAHVAFNLIAVISLLAGLG